MSEKTLNDAAMIQLRLVCPRGWSELVRLRASLAQAEERVRVLEAEKAASDAALAVALQPAGGWRKPTLDERGFVCTNADHGDYEEVAAIVVHDDDPPGTARCAAHDPRNASEARMPGKEPAAPTCGLCGGCGEVSDMGAASGVTCPRCKGSGEARMPGKG
jgi:hypothetical protein